MSRLNRALLVTFLGVLSLLVLRGELLASDPVEDPDCFAGDPECDADDPPPNPDYSMTAIPATLFGLNPGQSACYPALSANNSAGILGYVSFSGTLNAWPKRNVWRANNFSSSFSVLHKGKVLPDWTGFFQRTFNRANGYGPYLPGVFQFCLTNPSKNTQPIYFNASVVTY